MCERGEAMCRIAPAMSGSIIEMIGLGVIGSRIAIAASIGTSEFLSNTSLQRFSNVVASCTACHMYTCLLDCFELIGGK